MAAIISVHEYVLKPGADESRFEQALQDAAARGLVRLPGLIGFHFVKGIKGVRQGGYAAIWVYESRAAWEALWGTPERPRAAKDYPATWHVWEDEVLAPFLYQDPDRISFTTYEALEPHGSAAVHRATPPGPETV
jgi:hypothetical protein